MQKRMMSTNRFDLGMGDGNEGNTRHLHHFLDRRIRIITAIEHRVQITIAQALRQSIIRYTLDLQIRQRDSNRLETHPCRKFRRTSGSTGKDSLTPKIGDAANTALARG